MQHSRPAGRCGFGTGATPLTVSGTVTINVVRASVVGTAGSPVITLSNVVGAFVAGQEVSTGFIGQHFAAPASRASVPDASVWALAAWLYWMGGCGGEAGAARCLRPWNPGSTSPAYYLTDVGS